jgi:hypothetical protein
MAALIYRPVDWLVELEHNVWQGPGRTATPHECLYACADDSLTPRVVRAEDLPTAPPGRVRLVCLSDTHERHARVTVPPGDVLVHTGDLLTINRHYSEAYAARKLRSIAAWLQAQPHEHKVVIGGNHDCVMESLGRAQVGALFNHTAAATNGTTTTKYLEDEGLTLSLRDGRRLSVYGSPCSRGSSANRAFQSRYRERVSAMPERVDVLLTHAPLSSSDRDRGASSQQQQQQGGASSCCSRGACSHVCTSAGTSTTTTASSASATRRASTPPSWTGSISRQTGRWCWTCGRRRRRPVASYINNSDQSAHWKAPPPAKPAATGHGGLHRGCVWLFVVCGFVVGLVGSLFGLIFIFILGSPLSADAPALVSGAAAGARGGETRYLLTVGVRGRPRASPVTVSIHRAWNFL